MKFPLVREIEQKSFKTLGAWVMNGLRHFLAYTSARK